MKSFHSDNGSEFLNWPLFQHLTGRQWRPVAFTHRRTYHKNDNAHVEQKNWTRVRQLFGHDRFEHPELVGLMNELYVQEWSQFHNHFRPNFKRFAGTNAEVRPCAATKSRKPPMPAC